MQPRDACGLGRIYLAFPILISVFLHELVKTRQPAIPEVKEQSWYLIFLFLIFLWKFPPFLFSFICDFGSQKGESIPEDGSTGSPNPAVLTECRVNAFWPGRGNLSLFPSFLLLQTPKWMFLLPRTSFCCLVHVPSEWRLSLECFGFCCFFLTS